MNRKLITLLVAGLLAVPLMGQDSCSESADKADKAVEDLEDVAGENDPKYRAKMRRVKLGMTKAEVRRIMGGPPRDTQSSRTKGLGRMDFWYYGSWQLGFTNGKLDSKNRY